MTKFQYAGAITMACSVTDLEASVAWFKDVLGFEEAFRIPEAGWVELETSTPQVTLGLGQNDVVSEGGTTPVFEVDNLEGARKELEDKGVKFDGETMEIPGMVKLATFFDPDGNPFMFSESLMEG